MWPTQTEICVLRENLPHSPLDLSLWSSGLTFSFIISRALSPTPQSGQAQAGKHPCAKRELNIPGFKWFHFLIHLYWLNYVSPRHLVGGAGLVWERRFVVSRFAMLSDQNLTQTRKKGFKRGSGQMSFVPEGWGPASCCQLKGDLGGMREWPGANSGVKGSSLQRMWVHEWVWFVLGFWSEREITH